MNPTSKGGGRVNYSVFALGAYLIPRPDTDVIRHHWPARPGTETRERKLLAWSSTWHHLVSLGPLSSWKLLD